MRHRSQHHRALLRPVVCCVAEHRLHPFATQRPRQSLHGLQESCARIAKRDPEGAPSVLHESSSHSPKSRRQRPQKRQLFCPAHPDQLISGNGSKHFLHLLTPEELKARGMSDRRAKLVIQAYPVLVLSNEWLEELFCPKCGASRWCHVTRHDRVLHSVAWAPRELWQQVARVDPVESNPSVSQYTRREARRLNHRRADGGRLYDPH